MTDKRFTNIGLALEHLMKNLKDDREVKVFDKVILGLGEKDVKQYRRCVGVCYVKGANDFQQTMGQRNRIKSVNSVVAFVVKGTQRARYDLAMSIADMIMTRFQTDKDWIHLKGRDGATVKTTEVTDFQMSLFPNNKRLDIACVFTLKHTVCK